MEYRQTDVIGLFQVGVPKDIGWAMATMHEDGTLTRVCKGCGVTSRDPVDLMTKYVRAIFQHGRDCKIMDGLMAMNGDGGSVLG